MGKAAGQKLFDVDCAFDDNDHEWYDHDTDPHELVNLANDRARRKELADLFERLGPWSASRSSPSPDPPPTRRGADQQHPLAGGAVSRRYAAGRDG